MNLTHLVKKRKKAHREHFAVEDHWLILVVLIFSLCVFAGVRVCVSVSAPPKIHCEISHIQSIIHFGGATQARTHHLGGSSVCARADVASQRNLDGRLGDFLFSTLPSFGHSIYNMSGRII